MDISEYQGRAANESDRSGPARTVGALKERRVPIYSRAARPMRIIPSPTVKGFAFKKGGLYRKETIAFSSGRRIHQPDPTLVSNRESGTGIHRFPPKTRPGDRASAESTRIKVPPQKRPVQGPRLLHQCVSAHLIHTFLNKRRVILSIIPEVFVRAVESIRQKERELARVPPSHSR